MVAGPYNPPNKDAKLSLNIYYYLPTDESDDEEEGQASNGSVLSFEDTPLRRAARG